MGGNMVGESTGVSIASKNPSQVSLECNQGVMWSHLLAVKHDFRSLSTKDDIVLESETPHYQLDRESVIETSC